ncbi:MAG: type I-B CRISPR-associated protein Cas5b [Deltaproteobacteria bacterium]|jgi:CRISPR-associated protein Cas5h|nr:type I-B CRISPR-associated protein Cas5b [Deltaproteobacteria bacterium]
MTLISIDLKSDFGFFKKPDINDSIYLTYNMIHKPALLGLFGAVLGLEGHKQYGKLPDYYVKLENIKIGIQPIGDGQKNGNFTKTTVKYNNATGLASAGTLNILEQVLIKPAYRIFLELDEDNEDRLKLYRKLENGEAVFIPYLGKNDFSCWWEEFKNYRYVTSVKSDNFKIKTIFCKPAGSRLNNFKKQIAFGFIAGMQEKAEPVFSQFERLPTGFSKILKQYREPQEFVYTNIKFSKTKFPMDENFRELENGDVIYLF